MERLEIATKAKAGLVGYKAFSWSKDVPYAKRRTEYCRRFKQWETFVGEEYLSHLLCGRGLRMGPFIGRCVLYRSKVPAAFPRHFIDWQRTQERRKLSFYGQNTILYEIRLWVLDNHPKEQRYLYPKIAPKHAKAFYKEAYENIQNFQISDKRRNNFLRDTGTSGKAAFDELYQRGKFEKNILIKAGKEILGLNDDKLCIRFADAYNECFYKMTHSSARENGKAYHGFLLFSRTHTIFRYKHADEQWIGKSPKLQEDGYLRGITKRWKNSDFKLKYPSRMVHYVFWLCKRQSPDSFLDTDKAVQWVHELLTKEGETGIPFEYVAYLGERFHRPYIHNFKKAFQYN